MGEHYGSTVDDNGTVSWWRYRWFDGMRFGVPCHSPHEYLAHALLGWMP